jgi:hypothetical protein
MPLAWRATSALLLVVVATVSRGAPAATVRVAESSHGCLIDIDGGIDRTTPRLLGDAMRRAAVGECLVRVNSRGGNLDAALEAGRAIRRLRASTLVAEQATCASACVLLFVGGVQRQALGGFGLHRAYSNRLMDSMDEAGHSYRDISIRIRRYLSEMNIPERLLNLMNSVPPGQVRMLHPVRDLDLRRELHIVGEDPAWADQRASAEARRLGISRQEYYGRQFRAEELCNIGSATAATARTPRASRPGPYG